MENVMKLTLLLTVLLALALLASCGGRRVLSVSQPRSLGFDAGSAIAEVEAADAPDGVNGQIWKELKDALCSALAVRTSRAPSRVCEGPVLDLREDLTAVPPDVGITWTNAFFAGDGNADGIVSIVDLTPLAVYFGESVQANRAASAADYSRDGVVDIADISPLAAHFGEEVERFSVELSFSQQYDYCELDEVDYTAGDVNERGFRVYHYAFGDWDGEWDLYMRVVPFTGWDYGEPSEPVFFRGSVLSRWFDGILVHIQGTINTTPTDRYCGTDCYSSLDANEHTGDVPQNTEVVMSLVSFHFMWEGYFYGYGEEHLHPPDWPESWYEAFWRDSRWKMIASNYTRIVSADNPPDEDVFIPNPKEPGDEEYSGVVGCVGTSEPQLIATAKATFPPPCADCDYQYLYLKVTLTVR